MPASLAATRHHPVARTQNSSRAELADDLVRRLTAATDMKKNAIEGHADKKMRWSKGMRKAR